MEDNKEELRKLPKNIRQIGEIEDMVKVYIEDYANIYLKKLRPSSGQGLKIGLLLGDSMINDEGVPYIFIEGAMEIEGLEATPGEIAFSNEVWSAAYEAAKKYFPGLAIQGWFICGSLDVKLDPLAMWSLHTRYFPGKNQILYLSPTYEVDESLYVTSVNGFYKVNGHHIFYERNELMQDYMILRKESQKIEAEVDDRVIRNFRTIMEEKKQEEVSKTKTVNLLYSACTFLTLVIFAIGITMINTHDKMKSMEAAVIQLTRNTDGNEVEVVVATIPETSAEVVSTKEQEAGVIINEIAGEVYQTETETELVENSEADEANIDETEPVSSEVDEILEEQTEEPEEYVEADESEADYASAESEDEPTAAIASTNVTKMHTVSQGDTLYTISLKYYDSLNYVDKICEINELEDQDKIYIGQELQLP